MSIFEELLRIFCRHDLAGLVEIGAPEDEYWPEVEALLPRLREATCKDDLKRIIHSVFLQKFEAEETCGPEPAYEAVAEEIWDKYLAEKNSART